MTTTSLIFSIKSYVTRVAANNEPGAFADGRRIIAESVLDLINDPEAQAFDPVALAAIDRIEGQLGLYSRKDRFTLTRSETTALIKLLKEVMA